MSKSKVFVSDLTDNSPVETVFLAADKSVRETRNGDPYLCITLQDRTGTVEARGWDDAEALESRFEVDDFIAVRGRVSSYRGELQITVADVEPVSDDDVELSNYLPHSRWEPSTLFDSLRQLVSTHVESDEIRRFLHALFSDQSRRDRYVRAPAAVSNHHDYLAGLVEHTLSMARLAVTMGCHYDAYYPGMVDTDLLVAGCIIHDIGKIDELDYRRSFEYTTRGRLVGHVAGGAAMVGRVAESLDPPLDEHLKTQLEHLVLSHHGKQEYGAPVSPRSPEALLLHHLDMIDSRMNACWDACRSLVEDEEDGEGWSDYQRMFEGSLYVSGEAADGWRGQHEERVDTDGPGLPPVGVAAATDDPPQSEAESSSSEEAETETAEQNLKLFGE